MAGSFREAFNKAVKQAQSRIAGIREKRSRKKSNWQKIQESIGTWQESRERFERAKREKPSGPEPVMRPIREFAEIAGPGESRKLIRRREFDMKLDEDPAFGAWVNRVGAQTGAKMKAGKTLTQSRLDYLIELFGVEDELALYEYIVNDPDFGYEDFQKAYEQDGKNKAKDNDYPYTLQEAISMHMAQISLFKHFPIYQLVV